MADSAHKFYCFRCDRYLFGDSLTSLATGVNGHNTSTHPADFASWTAEGITHSTNYSGSGPLPAYIVPYGTTSKKILTITDEDRAMLAAGHVKWD
jgi:hypothetical protein